MAKTAVAISAFRSDAAVIRLVEQIVAEHWPVDRILIVDSLGSGAIESFVRGRGLGDRVVYDDHRENLGSAGNLQRRIELATEMGCDYVLALNHDAVMSAGVLRSLVEVASTSRIGAVYPLRYRSGKRRFDLTGVRDFSLRVAGPATVPAATLVPVRWSSSNGALYATAPLREAGIRPDGSLWSGWEDLLYGLDLHAHGYPQFIVTSASTVDEYEYREVSVLGRRSVLMDKPAWALYYSVRNQLAIRLYRRPTTARRFKVVAWALLMAVHAVSSTRRFGSDGTLRAYLCGVRDGLLNRRGKWRLP